VEINSLSQGMVPDFTLTVSILSVSCLVVRNYHTVVPKRVCVCFVYVDKLFQCLVCMNGCSYVKQCNAYEENNHVLLLPWFSGYK
jgi:hypothetical protein